MKHCTQCGALLGQIPARGHFDCQTCGGTIFRNPAPVVVALIPVDTGNGNTGLLVVRRSIPPKVGELALPGGFLDHGKDWRQHLADEVLQETGIVVDPELFEIQGVENNDEGTRLLIFAQYGQTIERSALENFVENDEVSELDVIEGVTELAFPLHTIMAALFFKE